MRIAIILSALTLTLTACGGGEVAGGDAALPPADRDTPTAAGACLEGEPDCQDMGGPATPAIPLPDGTSAPTGPFTVDQVATARPIDGTVAVEGFLLIDADGTAHLCSALAESYPPQCGGSRLAVDGDVDGLGELSSAGGVMWSDAPILVTGTWDGDTFTLDA